MIWIVSFILTRVDFQRVIAALSELTVGHYFAALYLYFLMMAAEAASASESLRLVEINRRYIEVLKINYFSHFFSVMTAFAGIISRWHGFSGPQKKYSHAFTAIAFDRLANLSVHHFIFVLFYSEATKYFPEFSQNYWIKLYMTVGSISIIITTLIIFSSKMSEKIKRMTDKKMNKFSVQTGSLVGKSVSAVNSICGSINGNGRYYLRMILAWICYSCIGVFLLKYLASIMGMNISTLYAVWIYSVINLAQLIPISIFGIGIRDGILILCLSRAGFAESDALALGIVFLSLLFFHIMIGGIWFLLSPKVNDHLEIC